MQATCLTQKEPAHRNSISAVSMSDIDHGAELVTLATIAKPSKGLGPKVDELLFKAGG